MSTKAVITSYEIERIDRFVNEYLREDLKKYDQFLSKTNAEIVEYIELKNIVKNIYEHMRSGFKTQMNIGGNFFVQAKVEDTEHIMVNVGLDHYVNFTLDEALKFSQLKINQLNKEADVIRDKSIETRANIKLALLTIEEGRASMSAAATKS